MSDPPRRPRGPRGGTLVANNQVASKILDARLGALATEAQELLAQACDLLASAGAPWDSKDLLSLVARAVKHSERIKANATDAPRPSQVDAPRPSQLDAPCPRQLDVHTCFGPPALR